MIDNSLNGNIKTLGMLAYALGLVGCFFGIYSLHAIYTNSFPIEPKMHLLPIAATFLVLSFLLAPAAILAVNASLGAWIRRGEEIVRSAQQVDRALSEINRGDFSDKHDIDGVKDDLSGLKREVYRTQSRVAVLRAVRNLVYGSYLVFLATFVFTAKLLGWIYCKECGSGP